MTRYLMTASAIVLGILGLLTTFAPDYVLRSIGAPELPALLLMTQIVGALYVGFAGLNWMARDNLIGGIYSRPVAIGNLMHFLVAAFAILRVVTDAPDLPMLWPLALIYIVFAAAFGVVMFRHPIRKDDAGR